VFTFGQQAQKNQETIEALQQQMRDMTTAIHRLAFELQRVRDELQHLRENEAHEREKLMLRLENELLKFERRLPSGRPGEEERQQEHNG
jgi:septation ring formation regulator EzrA